LKKKNVISAEIVSWNLLHFTVSVWTQKVSKRCQSLLVLQLLWLLAHIYMTAFSTGSGSGAEQKHSREGGRWTCKLNAFKFSGPLSFRGCTVVWWLAPSPHSKKLPDLNLGWDLSVWSLHVLPVHTWALFLLNFTKSLLNRTDQWTTTLELVGQAKANVKNKHTFTI